ncbi:HCLS1-associated protein X-1 isoform X2 [Rana temporaria]|nr:HCLS1-associated protein X-1 isoform X2 [Rana temporaria]
MTPGDEEDDDDEDEDSSFHGPSGFHSPFWGGRPPFQDPFGFEEIFRDFNELFSGFGAVMGDVPRLPEIQPPRPSPEGPRGGSLRDFMLKYPDSFLPKEQTPPSQNSPTEEGPPLPSAAPRDRRGWLEDNGSGGSKQDKVLDSEVSSRGLDSVLKPQAPPSSSFFRSVSISKVMRPDGTVEERRTVRDGQGNTTTTVTVTRGDEVISSGSPDAPRDSIVGPQDSAPLHPLPSLPDLSDSQTILSRLLHRWFSDR